MKSRFFYFMLFFMILLTGCKSGPQPVADKQNSVTEKKRSLKEQLPKEQVSFSPTPINRELGYQMLKNGNVIFVFDPEQYQMSGNFKVFIEGSFNDWLKGIDTQWLMKNLSSEKIQILEMPYSMVAAPGNCGFPEFKFYVIHEDSLRVEEPAARTNLPGFRIGSNHVLLRSKDDPKEVLLAAEASKKKKELASFQLRDSKQAAQLSNVRAVPGTKQLWRGYHPYKISRPQQDTELPRLELVKKSLKNNGIRSIICLSGAESSNKHESICNYQQDIINAGNQLYLDTSYNAVYYHSDSREFHELIAKIIRFIGKSPAPFYVHCRLGSDRTGMVSSVLAGLCGASWEEILSDYQKTNEMGIGEFRSARLLQYSWEHMLGKDITSTLNLQKELTDYLTGTEYLTTAEIDRACQKLKGK